MTGALLTALFFGIAPVCANRAIRLLGVLRANLLRLLIALAALAVWAFIFGDGLGGRFAWFFIAGAIGFGLGGISMFQALPRLGAPLASLVVEGTAALAATTLAWAWFNDSLKVTEIAFCLVIFLGIAIGLLPYILSSSRKKNVTAGAFWGILAAIGQGISFTVSRKALVDMASAGETAHLPTAAFQRLLGGTCIALVALFLLRGRDIDKNFITAHSTGSRSLSRPMFWASLNALFGPILGVTCLIWALKSMQAGVVQTIAATAPLISVPFARWLEGHRPPLLYYAGAVIAIAGLAGLYLYR